MLHPVNPSAPRRELRSVFHANRPSNRRLPHARAGARSLRFFIIVAAIGCTCFAQNGGGLPRDHRTRSALPEWQRLPGPDGGSVREMYRTPWGSWYAGSEGGVYRSDDDGRTWQSLAMLPIRFNSMRALVPVSPAVLAVCTDRGSFRSSDGGASWFPIPAAFTHLALDSSGALCGLLGNAVYVSPDSGVSWNGPTLPAAGVFASIAYSMYAPARGTMLAISRATLYRSTDAGQHWDSLAVPFASRTGYDGGTLSGDGANLYMTVLPSTSNLIWIYASSDTGRSWREIAPPVLQYSMIPAFDARHGRIGVIERQTADCRARLHMSTDDGQSWSDDPLTFSAAMFAHIRPDGDIFASTWDGVHRVDGLSGSTADADLGHATSTVRALATVSDSVLVAMGTSRVYRSTDAGATWTVTLATRDCYMLSARFIKLGSGTLFASGVVASLERVFYRSEDGGQRWMPTASPRSDRFPDAIATDGGSRILAAYGNGELWISSDGGTRWDRRTTPFPGTTVAAAAIDSGGRIFVCQENALRYSDDGLVWMTPTGTLPAMIFPRDLFTDNKGSVVLGASYDGVFRSSDRGEHWEAVNTRLTPTGIMRVTHDGHGTLFATDGEYTYRLLPGETRWELIARRPIPVAVRSFECAASGRLFAGTQNFGVWQLDPPPPDTDSSDDLVTAAHEFVLLPGYPQPAAGSAALPFEIDRPATVTLVIHDLLGRQVHTDTRSCPAPGRYSFTWDGAGVAAGMYLCTVSDGSRLARGRLLRM